MPITTIAFSKSIQTTSLTPLDPVPDPHISYKDIYAYVPPINKLFAVYLIGADVVEGKLVSPKLRGLFPEYLGMVEKSATPTSPPTYIDLFDTPFTLDVAEPLSVEAANSQATTAYRATCVLWFGDAITPPPAGEIRRIKATTNITLAAYQWTVAPVSFVDTLPAGRYAVVGMEAISPNLIAARLYIPGAAWRPGVIGKTAVQNKPATRFIKGRMGVLGEFDHLTIPQVEFLAAAADTNPVVYFDLVKIA